MRTTQRHVLNLDFLRQLFHCFVNACLPDDALMVPSLTLSFVRSGFEQDWAVADLCEEVDQRK